MKKTIMIVIMALIFSGSLFAADIIDLNRASIEYSADGGKLNIKVTADTKGWLAIGLGSSRMDGAAIFIGYDRGGKQYFREDLGRGHSHSEAAVQRPVDYEVTESNGTTTLSFSVALSDFVKSGQTSLPVIVAYGARDNFTSLHRYRESAVLRF